MKKVIAITGKMGSGKSSLIKLLQNGFATFSVDKIQNDLYQKDNLLWKMVSDKYPQFIKDNQVDKNIIKESLINDNNLKTAYQEDVIDVLIPHLKSITENLTGLVFIEIPYINSQKLASLFTKVVEVIADDKIRLERIISRDKVSRQEALSWMNLYVENIKLSNLIQTKNNKTLYDLELNITEVLKCIIL